MPINLLSLPANDLQYALKCMDLGDIIAFSLCSKRTKSLVKSSNRKIDPPSVYVHENRIRMDIIADHECILLNIFDSYILIGNRKGTGFLRKEEFTQSHWIAHFMSIFNGLMVQKLSIDNDQLCFLDTFLFF